VLPEELLRQRAPRLRVLEGRLAHDLADGHAGSGRQAIRAHGSHAAALGTVRDHERLVFVGSL
jgi:hypothetical protein